MKTICLSLLLATGAAMGASEEPFRTDINPALRYYQALILAPDLASNDRDYLFNREWRGQKLPERFGRLAGMYDKEFSQVRQAARATVPCDWGIDMSPGPGTLLPGLARNKAIAQAARLRAMWALQQGRQADGRDDLLAALALARNTARDGVLISVLVQIAMENVVYSAVAENFYQFSPDTLKQLVDGFDAAPPRTTVAACIPAEKTFFADWLMGRVQKLQQDNPGNDAKVMAGIHELIAAFDGAGDEGPKNEARPDLWEQVAKSSKGTSQGVLNLLQEEAPLYERLAAVMALPPSEFESQLKQFSADIQKSSNPFVAMTFPAVEKCRPKEFAVLTELAMVRAAIEYKLHGEAGLKSVIDPCGQGPFAFERFVLDGVDRGFELKSTYQGRDFQEVLIFVEKEGLPFNVNGKKAGQAIPDSGATK